MIVFLRLIFIHCCIMTVFNFSIGSHTNFEAQNLLTLVHKAKRKVPISALLIDRPNNNYSALTILQTLRLLGTKRDNKRLTELLPLFFTSPESLSLTDRESYTMFILIDAIKKLKLRKSRRNLMQALDLIKVAKTLNFSNDSLSVLLRTLSICLNIPTVVKPLNYSEDSFLINASKYSPWYHTLQFYLCLIQQSGYGKGVSAAEDTIVSRINALALVLSVIRDRRVELVIAGGVEMNSSFQQPSHLFRQAINLLDSLINHDEQYDTIYDHDDWKKVSSYIRGTSHYSKLNSNSWHQLRQYNTNFLISFISTTSNNSLFSIIARLNNSSSTSCMIFGDGDFSFSRSLVTAWIEKPRPSDDCIVPPSLRLLSTVYDSYDTVTQTYDDSASNIKFLEKSGIATLAFSVDAKTFRDKHTEGKYDAVIFNFPYADVEKGRYSSAASTSTNKFDTMYVYKGRHIELLESVFTTCTVQRSRTLILTLLMSQAVIWEIENLAFSLGFALVNCVPIDIAYKDIFLNGYKRRRSHVDTSFPDTSFSDSGDDELEAWCFVFQKVNVT